MTTLDYQVSASNDDATESTDGICYPDNSALGYLDNLDTANVWNGFRFQSVTIPDGATIDAAYLSFYVPNAAFDEPDVLIYAHDTGAPNPFNYAVANISARTRTTTSVNWASTNLGSSAAWYNTSSIVPIIEELMATYSYASGSTMVFLMTSRAGTGTRDLRVSSYDLSGDTTKAAKLHIEYTAGGGGGGISIPVVMHHLRQQGIS